MAHCVSLPALDPSHCPPSCRIRPITIGRRNWQHIGSEAAGPVAANFMSLVDTCRRFAVDPLAYFSDLFARIAAHPLNRIAELTPYNGGIARRSGDAWYVGCMNAKQARSLAVPLDFLRPDTPYTAHIDCDDPTVPTRTRVAIDRTSVTRDDTLRVNLGPQNGQAVRIAPAGP